MLIRLNLKEKYPYAPTGSYDGGDIKQRKAYIQALSYDYSTATLNIFYRADIAFTPYSEQTFTYAMTLYSVLREKIPAKNLTFSHEDYRISINFYHLKQRHFTEIKKLILATVYKSQCAEIHDFFAKIVPLHCNLPTIFEVDESTFSYESPETMMTGLGAGAGGFDHATADPMAFSAPIQRERALAYDFDASGNEQFTGYYDELNAFGDDGPHINPYHFLDVTIPPPKPFNFSDD